MPIQQAALSLIESGHRYGYEIKAALEKEMGPQWGTVNVGHFYQVLDRLQRDGLITSQVQRQSARPDRTVFELTETGTAELAAWRASASPRAGGFRDDFHLKLAAASRAGEQVLEALVRAQRECRMDELAALTRLHEAHRDDPLVGLLVRSALLHTKADLQLLDEIDVTKQRLLAISTETPKRDSAGAALEQDAG